MKMRRYPDLEKAKCWWLFTPAAATPTELGWVPTWTTRTSEPRPFLIILGHEFSGEVQALGPGFSEFTEGDAVFGMDD
jgi:Alcohol dehydrogenase GroES-like domain